tara:strand:- start:813 stop:1241 length:429 start_codon:yes stop_codon:yes gene_type:complete
VNVKNNNKTGLSSMLKPIFSVLSTIQINFFTLFRGKKVGTDPYGNVYYKGKPRPGSNRERRWVVYKQEAEASLVPPEWHGWLHHQTDVFPDVNDGEYRKKWQKPHQANLTGTSAAYVPPGHASKNEERAAATGDYEAWSPPQ